MLVIDRFEGDYAVVEDTRTDRMINIRREFIDDGAKEGDVLALYDTFYMVDKAETEKRRSEISELQRNIFDKN